MAGVLREGQRGCWRSLTIQLIAIGIVVPLGCGLIFVPLWLVGRFDLSIWWLIVPAALFLLILIGGSVGLLGFVVYRRTRQLDEAVRPLGLTGSTYQLFIAAVKIHGKYLITFIFSMSALIYEFSLVETEIGLSVFPFKCEHSYILQMFFSFKTQAISEGSNLSLALIFFAIDKCNDC